MELVFQFFWLFAAFWAGLGNALFYRVRLRVPIREGAISREEANSFAVHVALWIGGPCLLLWVLQQFFAHEPSPFFMAWQEPYRDVSVGICLFVWLIGFVWIWFLGGDRKLARVCELTRYQTYIWRHPVAFRMAALLMLFGGVVALWQSDSLVSQLK